MRLLQSSKLAQYGLHQPLQDLQRYQDVHPSVSSKLSIIPYGGFSLSTASNANAHQLSCSLPLRWQQLSSIPAYPLTAAEFTSTLSQGLCFSMWLRLLYPSLSSTSSVTCYQPHRHSDTLRIAPYYLHPESLYQDRLCCPLSVIATTDSSVALTVSR